MHERQGRGHPLVAQVGVVPRQLRRGEHPLVDERARGERRDGQVRAAARLDHPADHVQLALERELRLVGQRGADEHLADDRLDSGGARPGDVVVHGHVAPAEERLTLLLDRLLDDRLDLAAAAVLGRQEDRPDGVAPTLGQLEPDGVAHELVGDLHEYPRAVARVELGPARAAVLEVVEHPERLGDGLVRAPVREIGYRADAARIVLKLWVVEARGPWSP